MKKILLVTTAALILVQGAHAQTSFYSVVDLGSLGGPSAGTAISATGQIAGRSNLPMGSSNVHAFRRQDGQLVDLGTLGGPNSYAAGIADDGTVVGSGTTTGETATRGFIAIPNVAMTEIGTLGGNDSSAFAVNNSLVVVGHSQVAGNTYTHAFLYTLVGGLADLGTLAGANFNSRAYAINDAGQIVGESQVSSGATHAFLRANGAMSDLGTLGGTHSYARAISSNGIIAGYSETAFGQTRAFLYERASMVDLGSLGGTTSVANGVNSSGHVVGSSYLADNNTLRAFIYRDGAIRNLNDLLTPNSGWTLTDALAINDAGQIVGHGVFDGEMRAFLLVANSGQNNTSAQPPRIYVNGGKKILTTSARIKITGSSGGNVSQIRYRINGKGPWRRARGEVSGWKAAVPLKPGRTVFQVVAISPEGVKSRPTKVVIVRSGG